LWNILSFYLLFLIRGFNTKSTWFFYIKSVLFEHVSLLHFLMEHRKAEKYILKHQCKRRTKTNNYQTKKFAVVGDVHGEQLKMISLLQQWEKDNKQQLDFVLQVGDFETCRDEKDLQLMSVPVKYRKLGDFYRFYKGMDVFPWPIYFIGGNHEAYGYLEKYPEGKELCKNCFYMGRTGVVDIHGLRVAGLSGIYSLANFNAKRPNLKRKSQFINKKKKQFSNKLLTYFNEQDIYQLLKLKNNDILLLHDWPENINPNGPAYGNPYAKLLVEELKPQFVFCGHIHHRHKTQIKSARHDINIVCLANLTQGDLSMAFYKFDQKGLITGV